MKKGFTLVEVLMAIAVFVLLAGGIFASVKTSFEATDLISTQQLESERWDSFQNVLRRFFVTIPADAKVELRVRQESGQGDLIEVLVWPVPEFLQFGQSDDDGVAMTALPDGKGSYTMAFGFFRSQDGPEERDRMLRAGPWLKLLPNVREVKWRFAPERNPIYSETWGQNNGRPGLAELNMRLENGDVAKLEYWIPPLQRAGRGGGEE